MLNLDKHNIIPLIDVLDTNITLEYALNEMKNFFKISIKDILSSYSLYHVVIPINNNDKYEFIIKKI